VYEIPRDADEFEFCPAVERFDRDELTISVYGYDL
jgi:hypothetical protein